MLKAGKKGGKKGAKKTPDQLEWTEMPFGWTATRRDGRAFTIIATVHEGKISHYTVAHIQADGEPKIIDRAESLDAAKGIAQKHGDQPGRD